MATQYAVEYPRKAQAGDTAPVFVLAGPFRTAELARYFAERIKPTHGAGGPIVVRPIETA